MDNMTNLNFNVNNMNNNFNNNFNNNVNFYRNNNNSNNNNLYLYNQAIYWLCDIFLEYINLFMFLLSFASLLQFFAVLID